MTKRTLASLVLATGLATTAVPAAPALADGAASTRNIILGGAAAAAGALILINHNKQVHAREAQMASDQAAATEAANNAQAAYAHEKRAYESQVALVNEYKKEVAIQHDEIVKLQNQVSYMQTHAFGQPVPTPATPQSHVAYVSYGWGNL